MLAKVERIFSSWSEVQHGWSEYFRHGAKPSKIGANISVMERSPARLERIFSKWSDSPLGRAEN